MIKDAQSRHLPEKADDNTQIIAQLQEELMRAQNAVRHKESELAECRAQLTVSPPQFEDRKRVQDLLLENAELSQQRNALQRRVQELSGYGERLKKELNVRTVRNSSSVSQDWGRASGMSTLSPPQARSTATAKDPARVLDQIKKMLNVRTSKEVLAGVQKMAKVLSAASRMELFIKNICNAVLLDSQTTGAPQQLEVSLVIPCS